MATRAPRFPANYSVVLRHGADLYSATISNISVGGACLANVDWLDHGQQILVDYNFGQTRAIVTWKAGKMAGVKFDDQLSNDGMQYIRASHRQAS